MCTNIIKRLLRVPSQIIQDLLSTMDLNKKEGFFVIQPIWFIEESLVENKTKD